jgi:hypothetical protein
MAFNSTTFAAAGYLIDNQSKTDCALTIVGDTGIIVCTTGTRILQRSLRIKACSNQFEVDGIFIGDRRRRILAYWKTSTTQVQDQLG